MGVEAIGFDLTNVKFVLLFRIYNPTDNAGWVGNS